MGWNGVLRPVSAGGIVSRGDALEPARYLSGILARAMAGVEQDSRLRVHKGRPGIAVLKYQPHPPLEAVEDTVGCQLQGSRGDLDALVCHWHSSFIDRMRFFHWHS